MLAASGARNDVSVEDLESVRAAARSAWQARYPGHGRRARGVAWAPLAAAAALVAVAVGVWWSVRGGPASGRVVAAVELLHGEALLVAGDGALSRPLGLGEAIPTNAFLETGEPGSTNSVASRLALRLASGASLRLDTGTRLRFETADRIRLERGALYFQSAGADPMAGGPGDVIRSPAQLVVVTSNGSFRDVGTQFEVRVEGADTGAVRLRVREGRVTLTTANGAAARAVLAGRGEELLIASGGEISRSSIPVTGVSWGWVRDSAPLPEIEGMTARRFLDWLAREQGLTLEFADAEAERIAGAVQLHGSIAGLSLDDAPGAVLASCGLAHEIAGERLRVSVRTAS